MDQEKQAINQAISEIEKLQEIEEQQIRRIKEKIRALKDHCDHTVSPPQNHWLYWIAFLLLFILIVFHFNFRIN